MSDENDTTTGEPTDKPKAPPPPPPPPLQGDGSEGGDKPTTEKVWTQGEVNALDKRRTAKAAKDAKAAIAEQLGVSVEEAAKIIAAQKEREEAEKSEAQRAQEAATAAQAEADAAKAAAELEGAKARLQQALLTPGENPEEQPPIRGDRLEAAMAIALPALLTAGDDVEDPIASAVEHVRTTLPEIFGASSEGAPKASTPNTPGRTNGERKPTGTSKEEAAKATLAKFREGQARPPVAPRT